MAGDRFFDHDDDDDDLGLDLLDGVYSDEEEDVFFGSAVMNDLSIIEEQSSVVTVTSAPQPTPSNSLSDSSSNTKLQQQQQQQQQQQPFPNNNNNNNPNNSFTSKKGVTRTTSTLDNEPASLEGILLFKRGKSCSSGSSSFSFWRRRYVVLNLLDGGSLSCYSFTADNHLTRQAAFVPRYKFSKLHRRLSLYGEGSDVLSLHIPARLHWVVKDIENDGSSFVIEIPTGREQKDDNIIQNSNNNDTNNNNDSPDNDSDDDELEDISTVPMDADESAMDYLFGGYPESQDELLSDSDDNMTREAYQDEKEEDYESDAAGFLHRDLIKAQTNGKPLRFYFKCQRGGNEKSLWLKAFSNMDRLSSLFRKKNTLLSSLTLKNPVRLTHSRTRSETSAAFAMEGSKLEMDEPSENDVNIHIWNTHDRHRRSRSGREKEHRVIPEYNYPNRWMTQSELQEEMLRESEYFHDLRQPSCNLPEVGWIQVEILAALGLPKLDRFSDSDACAYVVSGQYAFCTDVLKNKNNPMFLAKTQRACIIPIHEAYARVYFGVFDDDKGNQHDDFNGRAVLDISRLRPDSAYDVTLPLRLSKHVYTRRKRGAIRVRVKLHWTNLRGALLSYLPNRIPRIPRNLGEFSPNTNTTVPTGDPRAFRNVAITVHGSHLPGRFSFQQLRATLREINFTRKSVMTLFKKTIWEMREWENPFISAVVFLGWMHCIYSNSFALVPAYVVSYFMLHLVRNYAIYGMDGPGQRGFIPPSWEEMLLGLLINPESKTSTPIEPLTMGYQKQILQGSEVIDYKIETHEPRGKGLFRFLGFLEDQDEHPAAVEDAHLEFPFANGTVYPKFGVQDCIVSRSNKNASHSGSRSKSPKGPKRRRTLINKLSKKFDIELPARLRKDSSGMNDYDDEEQRFNTGKFIRKTGTQQLKGAASGLLDVGESLTEVTGLNYVVSPVMKPIRGGIKGGLHYVVPPIRSGIKTGYQQVMPPIKSGIKSSRNMVISPINQTMHYMRRASNEFTHAVPVPIAAPSAVLDASNSTIFHESGDMEPSIQEASESTILHPVGASSSGLVLSLEDDNPFMDLASKADPRDLIPDQDIDYTPPDTGKSKENRKRLTDDLVETKDKMHEMTFHLFNDQAYVVKNSNSCFFGHSQRGSSKRRKVDLPRRLNKLLQTEQYSHSNPVVARVGQYVEPMVEASHSFLCAFRALFNVMTWRDPFLTFWVSLFGFFLVFVLFIFPWRLFLFIVGIWFVGPQNYAVRMLRQKKILPPKKPRSKIDNTPEETELPQDQIVFRGHISQDTKRKPHKPVDPREVQHVVVPHAPLMYQRFYDWPPEQMYAQVRADTDSGPSSLKFLPGQASPFESSRSTRSRESANSYFTSTLSPIGESDKKDQ